MPPSIIPFISFKTNGQQTTFSINGTPDGGFNDWINWGDGNGQIPLVAGANTGTTTAGTDVVVNNGSGPTTLSFDTDTFTEIIYQGYSITSFYSLLANKNNLTSFSISNIADTSAVTNTSSMFAFSSNLLAPDLTYLNTSNVTNMQYMFSDTDIDTLDLSTFNTANVLDMEGMFEYSSDLTSLDVSGFDVSSVTNMSYLFSGFQGSTLDLSTWLTSSLTEVQGMFDSALMTSLNLVNFDTSGVTDMNGMFLGCENMTSLNVSSFDTSSVAVMDSMFGNCYSLTSLNLSGFDTANVESTYEMFYGAQSLTTLDLSSFDTAKVTDMDSMFTSCDGLTSLIVSSFDTSSVTSMRQLFSGCRLLPTLNLSSFNTSNVTNMDSMFENLWEMKELDLSSFDFSSVTTTNKMFKVFNDNTKLVCITNIDTTNVTSKTDMFLNSKLCSPNKSEQAQLQAGGLNWTKTRICPPGSKLGANNACGIQIGSVQSEGYVSDYKSWGEIPEPTLIVLWDDMATLGSNVTTVGADIEYSTDGGASWVTKTPASKQGLEYGSGGPFILKSFGNITKCAFDDLNGSQRLNQPIKVIGGKTLTSCRYMFYNVTGELDLSEFSIPNVTDIESMFNSAKSSHIYLSNDNNTNDMQGAYMFDSSEIKSIDFSNYNMAGCTSMFRMFHYATFLECISNLNTTALGNKFEYFKNNPVLVQPDAVAQADLTDANGANWTNSNACP